MVLDALFSSRRFPTVFLGSPEAEAEATANARIPLVEVYEDFHHLLEGLSREKFIIVGRKGSGKSAFAEYVYARARMEPNLACEFIRKSDSDLEKAVQLGEQQGVSIDGESFFRWVIYTYILRLFVDRPEIATDKDYEQLRKFLDKNAGYIKINELQLKELVSKHGFDVAVEGLKRFFSARFNKNLEFKAERAPYYRVLNDLEEAVIRLLSSDAVRTNGNSFVLFFDDLDVGFDANDSKSMGSFVSLLRACRYVNNEVFGKNDLKAKAILLVRDDIEAFVSGRFADTAKLFASYSSHINWYQEEYSGAGRDEDSLNLKKFINKRISYGMKAAGLPVRDDPWKALVGDGPNDRSSFNYVVTQTLFRPRDLLLFFLPLDTGKFSYPLSQPDLRTLVDRYSEELAKELKSELSSFYSHTDVETIFHALGALSRTPHQYSEALKVVGSYCKSADPEQLLTYLFDRSLIGTVDDKDWYYFKCRQPVHTSVQLSIDIRNRIVVQYGIRTYLRTRRYV